MTLLSEMTLQSGIFILLLILLRPFLKRKLPAASRYALWAIPALRLTIPLSFKTVLGLWQHVPAPRLPLTARTAPLDLAPAVTPFQETATAALPGTGSGMAAFAQAWIPSVASILTILWITGSLVMLIAFIRVNLRFFRGVRGAVEVGGIDSPLPVMLVTRDISPCLAGLIRPRILLPGHVLASPELTQMVILHEVTHYRHKDHLFTPLRSLLLILWWWNPLMWALAHFSQEDCEAACDEGVIRRMSLDERKGYGKSLVALLRAQHAGPVILAAGTAMCGSKKIIKERITMIANFKQKGRLVTLAAVLCIALLVPFLFSSAASKAPAEPLPTDPMAIAQRLHAAFSMDERMRLQRVMSPYLGLSSSPLQEPWEKTAQEAIAAIKETMETLSKKDPSPLNWAESDKAALLDKLADLGVITLPSSLSVPEKAQRFTDMAQHFTATKDGFDNTGADEEEETWQDQWMNTLSDPSFRSIKGKVDFKKEWSPKVEELLKQGVPLPENSDLRHLLSLDFQLPAADSMKEADALEKALSLILEKKEWKAESMDAFRLWNSAYLMEKDGTPVYWFSFSWDEDKLTRADKLEALEKQRLERKFPMVLAVKVNAKTGELYHFTESFDLMTPFNRTI